MAMTSYICATCGVQYQPGEFPPSLCMICEDERQYVNPNGQVWTNLAEVNASHRNLVEQVAANLYAIVTQPSFGINQRAHLLISAGGNILWDCITNLDEATISEINRLGGIKAIAVSHPHYFSTIVEWSKAFGDVPVYVNGLDRQWLANSNNNIVLWYEKELELWDGMRLVRCGGHFPGAAVLFHPANKGLLLVGDTIQVAPTLNTVSFMYSYPNMIPLPKSSILEIQQAVAGLHFDSMYGAFGKYIATNAKAAMSRSVARYLVIFEQ